MTNNTYYRVQASKLYEGNKCVIWAEDSAKVLLSTAQAMANEYDNYIHNTVVNAVGLKSFTYGSNNFNDIMELGDWMTDRDGKLTILLLDIRDGYKPGSSGYVAGYFYWIDLLSDADARGIGDRSNEKDMIYVDTYPSLTTPQYTQAAHETLAHEMQHLVNFLTSQVKRSGSGMDTWIDEGISMQMEQLYRKARSLSPEYLQSRINWFNGGSGSRIKEGNNFYVWGNGTGAEVLDDYATAYLFFQWLYQQNNKDAAIFKSIVTSTYPDYQAVTSAAKDINSSLNDWSVLLRTWLAANYIKGDGPYV